MIFAGLPVSSRATVMTDNVLLSIAEPSAESSIPTCPVLHFWIIACRWLQKNYKCLLLSLMNNNLFINYNYSKSFNLSKKVSWCPFSTLFFFSLETNKQCEHLLYYDFTQEENVHIHCLPSPAASIRRSTRRTKLSPFMSGYQKLSDTVVDGLMLHLYSF